jgi:ribosomal protein L7/L12
VHSLDATNDIEMKTLIIDVGLVLFGFLIGRFTAPRERTTVVYKPTAARSVARSGEGEANPADAEIESALRAGHKIEAIKLYREAYGTDLKSAKEAVEAEQLRLGM